MPAKTVTVQRQRDQKSSYRQQVHSRIRSALQEALESKIDQFLVQTVGCLIAETLFEFKEMAATVSTQHRQTASKTTLASFSSESVLERGKLLGRAAASNDLAQQLEWAIEALE